MTDRELLELAALAAGLRVFDWIPGIAGFAVGGSITNRWNPLQDSGDALELAVKLNMTVRCYMGSTCAQIATPGRIYTDADETSHSDPIAATRRAIVRAAAQIGKQLRTEP